MSSMLLTGERAVYGDGERVPLSAPGLLLAAMSASTSILSSSNAASRDMVFCGRDIFDWLMVWMGLVYCLYWWQWPSASYSQREKSC